LGWEGLRSGGVSQSRMLLTETVRGGRARCRPAGALAPWRSPNAVHDPAKVLIDLAVTPAMGRDCLADIAVLRAEPAVFGLVASDPTVSRTVDRSASDPIAALRAIHVARTTARAAAWQRAGDRAPDRNVDAGAPLIIDADATPNGDGASPMVTTGRVRHGRTGRIPRVMRCDAPSRRLRRVAPPRDLSASWFRVGRTAPGLGGWRCRRTCTPT
jgi:hypothetical protein